MSTTSAPTDRMAPRGQDPRNATNPPPQGGAKGSDPIALLREVGDPPRGAGQLEDVQPGVGAIDDVDIAAIVDLHVVGLDGSLAALLAVGQLDAALVGVLGDRRDVVGDLLHVI